MSVYFNYSDSPSNTVLNGCKLNGATAVIIPSTVTNIADSVFKDSGLVSVDFSACVNLKSIGAGVFKDCTELKSVNLLDCVNLKSIGANAFNNCAELTSVVIPANVESIGENAFVKTGLTSVSFASGSKLEVINSGVFAKTKLTAITLPASLKSIGTGAFSLYYLDNGAAHFDPSPLKSVDFSECVNLESIGDDAFNKCPLTSLVLPDSLTSIGAGVFKDCTELKSVNLLDCVNLKSIGANAFNNCAELTSVVIPANVESIGENAFVKTGLTSVSFASGSKLEVINSGVFAKTKLTAITLPASLKSIGTGAFSLYYLDNGAAHFDPSPLKSVDFSECVNLESIGDDAFNKCPLTRLVLPDSVRSIGMGSFRHSALSGTLELPKRLSLIGKYAFAGTAITLVKIPSNMVTFVNTAQSTNDPIFPVGISIEPYPGVKVNLNVLVNPDSKIEIFREQEDQPTNVIIANYKLPVDALYDDKNNSGLIEMVDNGNDIDVRLANSNDLTDAYKDTAIKLVYALERSLCDSFNCISADPFSDYKEEEKYTTQSDFGRLSLNCFAHYLMGHIDAALAITNDVSFMEKMLSLSDASDEVKDSTLSNNDGVSTALSTSGPSRFGKSNIGVNENSDITGTVQTETNARLAELLVRSILLKGLDSNGFITSTILNGVAPDPSSLANIVSQVISQDLNRAMGKNNRNPVLLPFYAGDIIYMNIKLKRPDVYIGAGSSPSSGDIIKNRYTKDINYALQFTLGNYSNVPPVNVSDGDDWVQNFKYTLA